MAPPSAPSPSRLLVVEDEAELRAMLAANLEAEGFQVEAVGDGEAALERLGRAGVDLAVLDVMLPGMDGFEVLRRLRSRRDTVPVLLLTARTEDADRVRGLSGGADDYLGKPFSMLELVARIRAVLRRGAPDAGLPRVLRSGPYRLDLVGLAGWRGHRDLERALRELRLLEVLMGHPGRVHSRRELVHMAWDADARPSPRTVDVHIASLRRKLGEPGPIQTLEREGYRWVLPLK